MQHEIYYFPTVEPTSFQILYSNLTQEPWISFELSDGSKSATIALSRSILKELSKFLDHKTK